MESAGELALGVRCFVTLSEGFSAGTRPDVDPATWLADLDGLRDAP